VSARTALAVPRPRTISIMALPPFAAAGLFHLPALRTPTIERRAGLHVGWRRSYYLSAYFHDWRCRPQESMYQGLGGADDLKMASTTAVRSTGMGLAMNPPRLGSAFGHHRRVGRPAHRQAA
jgi:hypothetical protein